MTLALRLVVVPAICACCGAPPAAPPVLPASVTGFFENREVRLGYRLDRPPGAGPFPAVVIGHGSGRTTKEVCRFFAARLLERGFATLCYDKRGVGDSTGEYSTVGPANATRMFADLAGDMAAGVRFLRGQRGIDAARIGLFGPSQAGWIIPLAAREVRPAFMILIVGPTVSVGEEIFYSRLAEETTTSLEEVYPKLPEFTGDPGFDPRPVLEDLNVPGLWLLGAEDRSIPTPKTVAILDELVARGRPFTRIVYSGYGHDLGGSPMWADIDAWLQRTVPAPRP
jgi:dienelactone hydrolase